MARTAPPPPAAFAGFADPAMRFFHDLDAHQDRAWFLAHKAEYEEQWARPMAALLAAVKARLEPVYAGFPLRDPKVFRLQRDVRFSLDKSPYKTHVSGLVALRGGGETQEAPAVLYLQLGTECFAGAGVYHMPPPKLAAWRAMLLDARKGAAFARSFDALHAQGFEATAMETLKTAPRGVAPDHPRIALLKQKGLALGFPAIPKATLRKAALVDWLVERCTEAAPMVKQLARLLEE